MTNLSVETPEIAATMTTNMLELNDEQINMVSGACLKHIWEEVKKTAADVADEAEDVWASLIG